jgi:prevent-host-death family protein
MTTISLEEMQRDLLSYLWQVEKGETVIVTRAGQPVAEIRPASRPAEDGAPPEESAQEEKLRPIGLAAGEFTVPDDFDDPLPEEILRLFEGSEE